MDGLTGAYRVKTVRPSNATVVLTHTSPVFAFLACENEVERCTEVLHGTAGRESWRAACGRKAIVLASLALSCASGASLQ